MIVSKAILFLLGLTVSISVFAQNCPQGIPQGTPSCIPPDQLGYQTAPPVNTAYWKKTWGAMADSPEVPAISTSTGYFTQRAASKEAMRKCKKSGGKSCKITFTYQNQCAVMAQPKNDGGSVQVAYHSAATIEEASQLALTYCAENNANKTCEIFYSNCTAPVLIR